MNAPLRRRAWWPLAVCALCTVGPLALAQPPGFPRGPQMGGGGNGGLMEKVWICERCKAEIPDTGGAPPTVCPKCGAKFSTITDANGNTTTTDFGKSEKRTKLYIFLAILGVAVVAAVIKGLIAAASGGGSSKKKKKKKSRRPRDDDDDEY